MTSLYRGALTLSRPALSLKQDMTIAATTTNALNEMRSAV